MQTDSQRTTSTSASTGAEAAALRFIAEQAMVPLDQLARRLECPPAEVEALADSLEENGYVRSERFTPKEQRWVWLTRRGSEASGTGLAHRSRRPNPRFLRHWRQINEVRLFLEAREPKGKWHSETMLHRGRRRGIQIPDGMFEVGGERHAIEVELSSKARGRYEELWALNSRLYDAVIYFCEHGIARRLRRIQAEGDWPKVIVRPLPNATEPSRPRRLERKRNPGGKEREAMKLIAEQGVVREDQLARFFDLKPAPAAALVGSLVEGNFAVRRQFFDGEPAGVYLTDVGNRHADTPLGCLRPKLGAVRERYVFNELRLRVSSRSPEARWISRRMLTKMHGRKESAIPGAEVWSGGLRIAVNYRRFSTADPSLVSRTAVQNARYDAVIFFCEDLPARRFMERLQRANGWTNVVARDLPQPQAVFVTQHSAERFVKSAFGY